MGLCAIKLPISSLMIVRISVRYLIIFTIKSEIYFFRHYLGLCQETMPCAVLFMMFSSYKHISDSETIWADRTINRQPNYKNEPTAWLIDRIHKSHNKHVPYATVHRSEHKGAHSYSEWCIVRYGTGALWDLWDWSYLGIPYDTEITAPHYLPFVKGIHL